MNQNADQVIEITRYEEKQENTVEINGLKVPRQKPSPPGILDPVKAASTEKSKDISPKGQLRESSCRTLQNKKWQRGSLRQSKMMPRGNVGLQE